MRDPQPFVLVAASAGQQLVSAANAAAARIGIVPGMPLADARALHPALEVGAADIAGDAASLSRLAAWCGRYSPWTAPAGPDAIWLDVTGCAHLRGGEAALAAELVARLRRQGIEGRAAIADTPGAASAVARHGAEAVAVVPPGEIRKALAPLPVAGLRLDPGMAQTLMRLGLRRIGDLYRLPRASLVRRFGTLLTDRLDQAHGVQPEPLSPLPPALPHWTRDRFAEPIATAEAIGGAAVTLVQALCRRLGEEGLGLRRLSLTLYRVDGTSAQIAIGTARPSREPQHLLRLLAERFDRIDPGLGIEDMVLSAPSVQPLAAAQLLLPGNGAGPLPDETELAGLIDRLGMAALTCPLPFESHVPERAVRFAPPLSGNHAKTAWRPDRLRPVRLLPRPEAIEAVALVPDDPPVLFHWRRLAHRVRRADGPERIAGEWWRGRDETRDYYRVEDEAGRRFWLYRAGPYLPETKPSWFLHGIFA
jgi:protein ImuB